LVAGHPDGSTLINFLLDELARFTGADWEQEDDVTLMTLERTPSPISLPDSAEAGEGGKGGEEGWSILSEFTVPSESGNERLAMTRVAEAVQPLRLSNEIVERLKTAVSEASMNAIEHGNKYRADLPVSIQVRASDALLSVRITDEGGSELISTPDTPDLEAKLEGLQSPRGWGLFLIQNMVDKMNIIREGGHHTVELILYLGGKENAGESV
jgi:anti-sigma regulatory factor (Ser/Thr protein kinase)